MKNGITTMINAFENVCNDSIPPSPAPKRSRPNSLKRKGDFEADDSNKRLTTGLSMYFSESLHLESPVTPFDSLETLNNRAKQVIDHLRSIAIPSVSDFRPWMDSQLIFYQRDLHLNNSSLWALTSIDQSSLMALLDNFKVELWNFLINLLHGISVKCHEYSWDQMESDDEIIDQILLLFQSSGDVVELFGISLPSNFCNGLIPCAIFFSHYSIKALNHLMSKAVVSDVRILQITQNFILLLETMHGIWNGTEIVSHQLEANCTEFGLGVCEHIGSLKDSDRKNSSRTYLLLSTVAGYIKALASLGDTKGANLQIIHQFIDSKGHYSV